ncbi:CRISPR-associated protein Cas4 [Clostridium sp.]|uniref:CRISPR-associated protein Cas4 n=1 Tax=Clostridium sp. TaxID=1506 RepID=UPI002625DC35
MKVNGTLINYYFHCKRQCFFHGNRFNLEDNSETVKVGKALHEEKIKGDNTELEIDNVKIDKLTKEYLTEIKKSDADVEAAKWQLLFYLKVLKAKGIDRKGKLEFIEKNKTKKKTLVIELTEENEKELECIVKNLEELILEEEIPSVINEPKCKKCAYYEYCYI